MAETIAAILGGVLWYLYNAWKKTKDEAALIKDKYAREFKDELEQSSEANKKEAADTRDRVSYDLERMRDEARNKDKNK